MKWIVPVSLAVVFNISLIFSQAGWTELTSGVSVSLNSVSAPSDQVVWTCGASGTILRTTNGGTNWTSVTGAPISNTLPLYCIWGLDANTALVTGSSASATFVYRTSNGGANWTQVFTQTGGFIDAIAMGNPVAGFMYGDPVGGRWSLWGTVNGGLTWDSTQFYLPQNGSEAGWNNAFFFSASAQKVWFGTSNTRVYNSTNLILWQSGTTTGQANSYAVWFNSATGGMTGGTDIMYTTNGGDNWSAGSTAMPGTGNITGIAGLQSGYWVTRLATGIYFTNNNGTNWVTNYTAPAGNYTHITKSYSGVNVLYAVRSNGGISKGINLLLGLTPVSSEVPGSYSLHQNYPNPFNPSTRIKFEVPASAVSDQHVKLVVFNEIGQQVASLVDENLRAGVYEVTFDASSFASGVYYYRLTAGSFTESKKMSLIK